MTDITADEARQVLWFSDGPGKDQFRAAWGRAQQLGLTEPALTQLTMADVQELLWAAHEAVAEEPEDPRRNRALAIITEAGDAGITARALADRLEAEGTGVRRETLENWLAYFEIKQQAGQFRASRQHPARWRA